MARKATINRTTKETTIHLSIDLDGKGSCEISTGIPFFDHMLTLFAVHGKFDLKLEARGDIEIDHHHTVEDIGIVLGQCISKALNNRKGINRYGEITLPMDEALVGVYMDLSNRPYLCYEVSFSVNRTGAFDLEVVEEFFRAVSTHGGITLHIHKLCGKNGHHIVEAIFKGFARALARAVRLTSGPLKIPSSKGTL